MLTDEKIADGCNKAYIDAGQNAYFNTGFNAGIRFAANEIISYIENDAEIAMPINELINEDGSNITKKKYGKVLLKYLVIELRDKIKDL